MELKTFVVQGDDGKYIPSVMCYLYRADTGVAVTNAVDASGAELPNPFRSSATGKIQLAAPNGTYELVIDNAGAEIRHRFQCLDQASVAELTDRIETIESSGLSGGRDPFVSATANTNQFVLDVDQYKKFEITLTQPMTNVIIGESSNLKHDNIQVKFIQGTGANGVDFTADPNIVWAGGIIPNLSYEINKSDLFTFSKFGNGKWIGNYLGGWINS